VASDIKAHFEKVKRDSLAKRNPKLSYFYLPKGELRKKVDEANRKMHELRKRGPLSDYERQLLKAAKAPLVKKKAGKGVLGLGETLRPLSPFILPNQYGSNVGRVHRKSGDTTFSDYEIENYFLESGLPFETIVGIAAGLEFPRAEVVDEWRRNFEPGRSLMNPKHLHVLGTQMYALNNWCMEASRDGQLWISVRFRNQNYFRGDDLILVQMNELHQLCHLDALDKLLISCYCL